MSNLSTKSILLKCSAMQGLYWTAFGTTNAFAVVSLLARGFHAEQIGMLLAMAGVVSTILQPTVATIADKSTKITLKKIISMMSGFIILLLIGLIFAGTNIAIVSFVYGTIIALASALQSFINSYIFEFINRGININFGATRGIGSISFAVMSFSMSIFLGRFTPLHIPFISIGLYGGLLLLMLIMPTIKKEKKSPIPHGKEKENVFAFLKKYDRFPLFLVAVIATFVFHTIAFTFLVQIMGYVGGNDQDFGLSITISAMMELPALLGFSYIVAKIKSSTLIKFAMFAYILRGIVLILATSVFMVNGSQLFQSLSFAIFLPASVYYVNQMMEPEDKVKGQAFLMGANTLGNVIGNLLGGWLLENLGMREMLVIATTSAVLGFLLSLYAIKNPKPEKTSALL